MEAKRRRMVNGPGIFKIVPQMLIDGADMPPNLKPSPLPLKRWKHLEPGQFRQQLRQRGHLDSFAKRIRFFYRGRHPGGFRFQIFNGPIKIRRQLRRG